MYARIAVMTAGILAASAGAADAFSAFKGRFNSETYYASCKEMAEKRPDRESGIYKIQPDLEDPIEPFEVYCDMTTNGGGWTLIGTMADDGNHYWTWANMWSRGFIRGNAAGEPSLEEDHQSEAWATVAGDEVLIRSGGNRSKWLRYDGVLSDQTMGSRYPGSLRGVGEFHVSAQSGSWQYQCGSLSMMLLKKDPDGHDTHHPWAIGFNWRSKNNHHCNYDDMYGGINAHQTAGQEIAWSMNYFYNRNFNNDAMAVFVR